MAFDVQKVFAERIGGEQFGQVQKVFKFTLIDNAKKAFIAENPQVKVIDMGVGEPEERAPDNIAKRMFDEALVRENRIYPCNGTMDFREAACRYIERLVGVSLDPNTEMMHCIGAKAALAQVPLAFINPGDSSISTIPGYPVYDTMVSWLGGKNHAIKLHQENGFLPDLTELKDAVEKHQPKTLLLNYPNNPTGGIADVAFYEQVIKLAHENNFIIVQDAAYADYLLDSEYVSPLQIDGGKDVTLELYSLSKGFNMQGYRLGFVCGDANLVKAFALVKDNTDNGQFIAIQMAGVEALDESASCTAHNREKYIRRMKKTAEIFNSAGIEVSVSPGSFYLYFKIPEKFHGHSFNTAQEFTNYLISEFGIITVPWEEAGPHIRLSMTFEIGTKDFATEDDVFAALAERLVDGRLS